MLGEGLHSVRKKNMATFVMLLLFCAGDELRTSSVAGRDEVQTIFNWSENMTTAEVAMIKRTVRVGQHERMLWHAGGVLNTLVHPKSPKKALVLMVTTHLSKTHMAHFKLCWKNMLARQALFANAEIVLHITIPTQFDHAIWVKKMVEASHILKPVRVYCARNPRADNDKFSKQKGAISALADAARLQLLSGYEWAIRLNPDVIVYNPLEIARMMNAPGVQAVFANCGNSGYTKRPHDNSDCSEDDCNFGRVMTDFMIFRPTMLSADMFQLTYTTQDNVVVHTGDVVRIRGIEKLNAEGLATETFEPWIKAKQVKWFYFSGPNAPCRVGWLERAWLSSEDGSIIHGHDTSQCRKIYGELRLHV